MGSGRFTTNHFETLKAHLKIDSLWSTRYSGKSNTFFGHARKKCPWARRYSTIITARDIVFAK